jgi:lipoyl(octanoyl) transferase
MSEIKIKRLGQVDYLSTWQAMKEFTAQRNEQTADELWIVEHAPVYTLGMNGKSEHLPEHTTIPVIKIDRGGQVTYHGPGQVIIYLLVDLQRMKIGVRALVRRIEQAVIELLKNHAITANGKVEAPGVYVNDAKIAALGLKINRGCSYHGVSLNVDMDLSPFYAINPCGYPGLQVTQTKDLGIKLTPAQIADELADCLTQQLAIPTEKVLEKV